MFVPRSLQTCCSRLPRLASTLALLLGALFFAVASVRAQTQEEGTLNRILHPDRTMKFDAADKQFATTSSVGSKQANIKAYSFGVKGSVFGRDGKFRAKGFNNPKDDGFRTESFASKTSQLSMRNSFAQGDKAFGTKAMDVREAPSANKSALTKEFLPANQSYTMRGKRQDHIDDVTKNNKDLTIDQVRDLLNKGPEAKR